jgi:hypothetical protein
MIQGIIDFLCKECMEIGGAKIKGKFNSYIKILIVKFNLFVCFTKRRRTNFARSNLHISGFAKQQKGGRFLYLTISLILLFYKTLLNLTRYF